MFFSGFLVPINKISFTQASRHSRPDGMPDGPLAASRRCPVTPMPRLVAPAAAPSRVLYCIGAGSSGGAARALHNLGLQQVGSSSARRTGPTDPTNPTRPVTGTTVASRSSVKLRNEAGPATRTASSLLLPPSPRSPASRLEIDAF